MWIRRVRSSVTFAVAFAVPLVVSFAFAQEGAKKQEAPKPAPSATGDLSEEEFAKLHQLKPEEAPPPKGTTVDLADGSKAYLALPKDWKPGGPAMVVVHEWWGLNGHVKHWADRLTSTGRAALAVDLYDGKVATDAGTATQLMKGALGDEKKLVAKLLAARDFARKDERVKAGKLGSIGWCFGGRMSLLLAIAAPDLDACVMYYGFPVDDVAELKKIKAPLLGVFANKDKAITPAKVDAFEKELKDASVNERVLHYDADHAFANPSGANYDTKAAAAAWAEVQKFLDEKVPVAKK
jgi:carboxymethylenebutenolidase